MKSLLKSIVFTFILYSCGNVNTQEKAKFDVEILKVDKNNACLDWARAYISQRDPYLFGLYDDGTKCRLVRFTLDESYPRNYYYLEMTDNKKHVEGYLFENFGTIHCFMEKIISKNVFIKENVFQNTGYVSFGEKNIPNSEDARFYYARTFPLENTDDLIALVEILRGKYKDKFLELEISKEKFADVPEDYKKTVVEKIREYIIDHDMKSEKVLEALGKPLPRELRIKIMPFTMSNHDFYYMYDNTKDRVLRRVTSDADGGFFPEREATAVGEVHNVETVWVDKSYVDDGPTEYESSKKFYKTLERDGIQISVPTKK